MTASPQAWKAEIAAGARGDWVDDARRELYATDASLYRQVPAAVLRPRDREDAARAVAICARHGVPVIARGGGTSLTGQSIGEGLILDFSTHLNRVLEIHPAERWVRVEPGATRDELNAALRPHGLHFAPDPASGYAATVGGMIATNAAGMRSIRYGMTVDHVRELTVIDGNGDLRRYGVDSPDATPGVETLRRLVREHEAEIRARTPAVLRRSGGYRLEALMEGEFNPAKIFCSAEGTLGVVVEARLHVEPLPGPATLVVAAYPDVWAALRATPGVVARGIGALELLDDHCLRPARTHPLASRVLAGLPAATGSVLMAETGEEDPSGLVAALGADWHEVIRDPARQAAVWGMRSAALGLINHGAGAVQPQPYIEDAAVPLDRLEAYIREVRDICARHGRDIALFAHASVGLLHIRPLHDLRDPKEIALMEILQREVFAQVRAHGGSWSGEHGDGQIRGAFIPELAGPVLTAAFTEVKHAFDPRGIFNPGKKIAVAPPFTGRDFRHHQDPTAEPTFFRYPEKGSALAELSSCNRVGNCRQLGAGAMCPSFRATRREEDTVRGRALALRAAMNDPSLRNLAQASLDLCLGCKACKSECPNRVDLARLKAESRAAEFARTGTPWRERVLANPDIWLEHQPRWLAARAARSRWLARLLGLSPDRPLPCPAPERFTRGWAREKSRWRRPDRPEVVMFVDTWTEHYAPAAAWALVRLLHALGRNSVPVWLGDSQRAALSRGLLAQARQRGGELLRRLDGMAGDAPILVLEPSCHSALVDDLPDLVEDAALAKRVRARVRLAEAGVLELLANAPTDLWREPVEPLSVLIHPHCHARALGVGAATRDLLGRVPGLRVRETGAGCCGMAGAFGYEAATSKLSSQVAEDRYLPALRGLQSGERFAAHGFSCRSQATDLAGVAAQHPLEIVAERVRDEPAPS